MSRGVSELPRKSCTGRSADRHHVGDVVSRDRTLGHERVGPGCLPRVNRFRTVVVTRLLTPTSQVEIKPRKPIARLSREGVASVAIRERRTRRHRQRAHRRSEPMELEKLEARKRSRWPRPRRCCRSRGAVTQVVSPRRSRFRYRTGIRRPMPRVALCAGSATQRGRSGVPAGDRPRTTLQSALSAPHYRVTRGCAAVAPQGVYRRRGIAFRSPVLIFSIRSRRISGASCSAWR